MHNQQIKNEVRIPSNFSICTQIKTPPKFKFCTTSIPKDTAYMYVAKKAHSISKYVLAHMVLAEDSVTRILVHITTYRAV